jgi:hypothetical protein
MANQAGGQIISTQFGEVQLLEPSADLIQAIRAITPFGMVHNEPPEQGADYGLVMQCGQLELFGVRQQAEPRPYQASLSKQYDHNILIAHSLAAYRQAGFAGLFLPCSYLTVRHRPLFESGIAYFGYPSPQGRECNEYPFGSTFDERFGYGFTTMMTEFMRALQQSSHTTGIPLPPPVGLNVRYRSQLGYLDFGFMLVGSQVVCLKTHIMPETDLAWTALRETGITTVFHLPCLPAAIEAAQLPLAKPGAELNGDLLPQPGLPPADAK